LLRRSSSTPTHIRLHSTDTPTAEISTLPLHDALPILCAFFSASRRKTGRPHRRLDPRRLKPQARHPSRRVRLLRLHRRRRSGRRSEEHTSELQSRFDLVCRLLLEKKNQPTTNHSHFTQ